MPRLLLVLPLFASLASPPPRRSNPHQDRHAQAGRPIEGDSRGQDDHQDRLQGRRGGDEDEVKSCSLVYVDEIIENPMNSKRPDQAQSHLRESRRREGWAKAQSAGGGRPSHREEGEKPFTQNGKAVTGDTLRILEDEFNGRWGRSATSCSQRSPSSRANRGRSMARNWRSSRARPHLRRGRIQALEDPDEGLQEGRQTVRRDRVRFRGPTHKPGPQEPGHGEGRQDDHETHGRRLSRWHGRHRQVDHQHVARPHGRNDGHRLRVGSRTPRTAPWKLCK